MRFACEPVALIVAETRYLTEDALGLAPEAIRLKHFIQAEEFPSVCATGSRYDSGNSPAALKRALELADY